MLIPTTGVPVTNNPIENVLTSNCRRVALYLKSAGLSIHPIDITRSPEGSILHRYFLHINDRTYFELALKDPIIADEPMSGLKAGSLLVYDFHEVKTPNYHFKGKIIILPGGSTQPRLNTEFLTWDLNFRNYILGRI